MSPSHIVLTDTDLQRLQYLSGTDLARLYTVLSTRLQASRTMEPNENVLTVRVPLEAANHMNALVLRHATTRSRILREALQDFLRRHPL